MTPQPERTTSPLLIFGVIALIGSILLAATSGSLDPLALAFGLPGLVLIVLGIIDTRKRRRLQREREKWR